MGIFEGLARVALSPLSGAAEVFSDLSGDNGESNQGLSILTMGVSSVVKGTAKGLKKGVSDIFEEE